MNSGSLIVVVPGVVTTADLEWWNCCTAISAFSSWIVEISDQNIYICDSVLGCLCSGRLVAVDVLVWSSCLRTSYWTSLRWLMRPGGLARPWPCRSHSMALLSGWSSEGSLEVQELPWEGKDVCPGTHQANGEKDQGVWHRGPGLQLGQPAGP